MTDHYIGHHFRDCSSLLPRWPELEEGQGSGLRRLGHMFPPRPPEDHVGPLERQDGRDISNTSSTDEEREARNASPMALT